MGSEMCIRDSIATFPDGVARHIRLLLLFFDIHILVVKFILVLVILFLVDPLLAAFNRLAFKGIGHSIQKFSQKLAIKGRIGSVLLTNRTGHANQVLISKMQLVSDKL